MTTQKSFVTDKIQNMPPSGIRKFFDVAKAMKDVVSLGVGEPDFKTPWNICEEAIYHLEHGRTTYTSNAGAPELRQEISRYMKRKYELEYDYTNQILVTVGASEAIDLAMRAVLDPGDEVLVVEPCYVSYRPCVELAGGVAVGIATKAENDFRLTPEELLAAITPKTKALLISYPNNPTGAIMEKADLIKIADILRDRDILVISDEIYAELTYAENRHISIATLPGMYEKTLVLNGFSKAYAMTGWRLGYACGPEDLIAAMTKIHQYVIMCAPTNAQHAAVEALRNNDNSVEEMRKAYDQRRRLLIHGFRSMGMDVFEPLGAFYTFPSVAVSGLQTEDFCTRMLFEGKVAVVPGTAFGACGEGFIRCSYAYSLEDLRTALTRIEAFLNTLAKN